MSLSGIQALEMGRKSPTVRTMDAIARALEVQTWTLLGPDRGPTASSRTRVSRRVIE
jgi:hypothetical protein